ncbi:MAG: DUF202 domain-containing protein [Pseudomonadota bacterium]
MSEDAQTTDLAKRRTQWAEDRTVLANERTFSSWMGTGLGCLGLAVGMQAVFGEMQPTWVAKAAATIFVVVAIYLFLVSLHNSRKVKLRLNAHSSEPTSDRSMSLIAYLLTVGAIATGVVLWLV